MKLFVWDFHGVLEKGNEFAVQEVCNKALEEFGVKRKVTVRECLNLYGKKWADYFRHFAPHLGKEDVHKMVDRAVEIGLKEKIPFKYIKPMDYAHEVLKSIAKRGHMNIIISNSSPESLDMFLISVNMSNSFNHKFGADGHRKNAHENNSKEVWLRNFLKENKFDKIIVIDDFPAGIEMGKNISATTYLFSRTGNFPKANADYKISDLREVLKEV